MVTTALIVLGGTWAVLSALLVMRLMSEYRRGGVQTFTAILLWPWHALNYALVGLMAAEGLWAIDVPHSVRIVGGTVGVAGLALVLAGFYEFRSVRRLSGTMQDRLIDSGIYRYSRHPQYAGIIGTLFGIALVLGNSVAALLFALALSLVLVLYLPAEERYVEQQFGQRYRKYRHRTPMLLGKPRV